MRIVTIALLSFLTFAQVCAESETDTITVQKKTVGNRVWGVGSLYTHELELSGGFRQHNVVPSFDFVTIRVEPVKRLNFGVSYVAYLGLHKEGGEQNYLVSQGIGGSVGYRLFRADREYDMCDKDFSVELRGRYAHSLGNGDLKFNLFDIGFSFYNAARRHVPYCSIGYRFVDSRTPGIRNVSSVYFAMTIW